MRLFSCALACAAMLLIVSTAQAALIVNGDFQTGDLTGWDLVDDVTVTTGGGGNSIANFDVSGGSGDARLYQNFDVGPSWSGIRVEFDFLLSTGVVQSSDFFKSFIRLETDGAPPDEVVVVVKENDPTSGWQHVVADISFAGLTVDPPPDNARLTFVLKENVGDWSWAKLDNVVVEAIPEPASILVWCMIGLCIAGIDRRRRRKA